MKVAMSPAGNALAAARALGLELENRRGRLLVRPRAKLTPDVRQLLGVLKAEILEELKRESEGSGAACAFHVGFDIGKPCGRCRRSFRAHLEGFVAGEIEPRPAGDEDDGDEP